MQLMIDVHGAHAVVRAIAAMTRASACSSTVESSPPLNATQQLQRSRGGSAALSDAGQQC